MNNVSTPPTETNLKQKLQEKLKSMNQRRTGKTYRDHKKQVKNSKVKNKPMVQRSLADEAIRTILSRANITGVAAEKLEKDILQEILLNNISNPMEMARVITKHMDIYQASVQVPQSPQTVVSETGLSETVTPPQITLVENSNESKSNHPVGQMRKPDETLINKV